MNAHVSRSAEPIGHPDLLMVYTGWSCTEARWPAKTGDRSSVPSGPPKRGGAYCTGFEAKALRWRRISGSRRRSGACLDRIKHGRKQCREICRRLTLAVEAVRGIHRAVVAESSAMCRPTRNRRSGHRAGARAVSAAGEQHRPAAEQQRAAAANRHRWPARRARPLGASAHGSVVGPPNSSWLK